MEKSEFRSEAVRATYFASLFNKPATLLTGASLQSVAISLAYLDTRAPAYIVLLLAVALTSIARYHVARTFHAISPDINLQEIAKRWERRHAVGLIASCLLVGLFGFFGVFGAPSQLAMISSTIVVMGSGTSVLGKYYGSKWQTNAALLALTAPFTAGLLMNGELLGILMALLALPFTLMISSLSASLRTTLFESARGRALLSDIADRFNTALNNMSHGLIMIDESSRIEVANRQLYRLLDLPPDIKVEGRLLDVVFTLARRQGRFATREHANQAAQKTAALIEQDEGGAAVLELTDQRALQITAKKRSKGGAVLLFEDITDRLAAQTRIERMARYDELTGLINRAFFKEQVDASLAANDGGLNTKAALFVIDVDEFKSINDTYGHMAGDELLKKLAGSLAQIARKSIVVSRFGGDEFAVFAADLSGPHDAEQVAKRIAKALNRKFELSVCRYSASVSIGYALSEPDADDFQKLMIRADLALYARKNDKSVPYRAYEAELDRRQRERLQLKSDLGAAIRDGSLHLVYQPVIDVKRHRMTSCEALVRWNHPTLGAVSPAVFVPLAEEMGIVGDLTGFVVREACRACAAWPENMSVSVNLSAIDFERPALANDIRSALAASGLAPSRLEVEITETAAIKSRGRVQAVLADLRRDGVKVALDDFGVGYSGLSHLHSLPLDRVKIDRSFILAINDDARSLKLLSSVLEMARVLDLEVTVEGVEDLETLERVIAAGPVNKVQGFVFGRHFSCDQVAELSERIYPVAAAAPLPSVRSA
ncbi:MAG: EAL domain-containing protein [Rhizobiaceae bacterium]|nr:EAL domain-containing protein [Rhizobiaceae bacterium]